MKKKSAAVNNSVSIIDAANMRAAAEVAPIGGHILYGH